MNIFVLDRDPQLAARYHNDKHVVKMIMESAQILSAVHHALDGTDVAKRRIPSILKATHIGHPVVKWAMLNSGNYKWTLELMKFLGVEYRDRFNGQHVYTHTLWRQLKTLPYNIVIAPMTEFCQCVSPKYLQIDPVAAYRDYYFGEKFHIAKWRTPALIPDWWKERERRKHVAA